MTRLSTSPMSRQRLHGNLLSRLDLVTLRLFVAIVEEQSINKAAEREFIAPSAVSKRIADLEHATQTQLFIRQRTGVQPTPAGQSLLNHARIVLKNLADLEAEIFDHAQGGRGTVRMLASESALFGYFPDALKAFTGLYPEIHLDLAAASSREVVTAVLDGSTDLGIFWDDIPTADLQVVACYSDRLVAVVPVNHPLARYETVQYSEVLEYDQVEQEANSAIQQMLVRQAAQLGITPRVPIRVVGYDAVCRMVEADLGVGIVPHSYISRLLKNGKLKAISLRETWVDRHYKVCVRTSEHQPVATRLMFKHLTGR